MIRLLVSDGRPIVREGISKILSRWSDIELTALVGDSANALSMMRRLPLDVMLLSTSTRGRGCLEILRRVRINKPKLSVVVFSDCLESAYAVRVLKAGACGYLSNDSTPNELVTAIRSVHSGRKYVSESLGDVLSHLLRHPSDVPDHAQLSNREYEVLCLMGAGKAISDIAPELGVSSKTVSTYRSRLLHKLNLRSSAEIIRYAIEHDLVAEMSYT